jgi:hypothetical protein
MVAEAKDDHEALRLYMLAADQGDGKRAEQSRVLPRWSRRPADALDELCGRADAHLGWFGGGHGGHLATSRFNRSLGNIRELLKLCAVPVTNSDREKNTDHARSAVDGGAFVAVLEEASDALPRH